MLLLLMQFTINQLSRDIKNHPHGILAINKPAGATSHDVVDHVRRQLNTRAVGHAGALDPFATGLLIILVGNATKLSDTYLNHSKEYVAKILFGIQTDTADPEGKIIAAQNVPEQLDVAGTFPHFIPSYSQFVPLFSSIKVNGEKLRILVRKYPEYTITETESGRTANFQTPRGELKVEIPKHVCQIPEIKLLSSQLVQPNEVPYFQSHAAELPEIVSLATAEVQVACSKGTYIRTLAEDIGKQLDLQVPAMLINLQRTKIADITISQALDLDEIASL